MAAEDSPDSLPSGWAEQFGVKDGRELKYYLNSETGQKFYSKKDLIRYIGIGNVSCKTPEQKNIGIGNVSCKTPEEKNNCEERRSRNRSTRLEMKTNETPEWLPPGWIMELKAKSNGRKYKCYIDPMTGKKFHSKPEVLRYLDSMKDNSSALQQKEIGTGSAGNLNMDQLTGAETSMDLEQSQNMATPKEISCVAEQNQIKFSKQSLRKGVIVMTTPDELPPGWIKEIKFEMKQNGIRKDPYYTDPVSGYVFRSVKDALRYVESGDIARCAIKPKKREEIGFLNGEPSRNMDQLTGAETSMDLERYQNMETPKEISCLSESNQMTSSKQSSRKGVVVTATPDELPPGWIKEIKIQKKQNGIRKDPFYIDPVSGYVFRSLKDALRYVATGDISRCASTPRKREQMGFLNGETSLNVEQFTGDESIVDLEQSQNMKTPEGISCALKQNQITFSDKSLRKVVKMATPDELPPGWIKEIKFEKKENGIRKDPYYTDPVSGYVFRSLQDALRYLRTGSINRCAIKPRKRKDVGFLNEETSGDSMEIVFEEKLIENDKQKKNSSNDVRRSSKRQAGLKPEIEINLAFNERGLKAAARNSGIPCLESVNNVTQSSSENKNPLAEQQTETKHKEDTGSPGINSWSDPCLEFAFKTLTGAIPVEDDLVNDNDPSLAPPKQTGISSGSSDAPMESASGLHLPANPPGNASSPSQTGTVPQQPSQAE